MMKNALIILLLILVAVLVWYSFGAQITASLQPAEELATTTTKHDAEICAQVITSARDPKSGTIRQFPTPCDVPKGWEIIQNDIPGFDLQVQ